MEEAETLLAGCHDDLLTAKLLLARGEPETAAALLQRISECRPNPADTAAVLGLLVQAQLTVGGPAATSPTLDRLTALAADNPTDYITAQELTASGRVALPRGDIDGATARLQDGSTC